MKLLILHAKQDNLVVQKPKDIIVIPFDKVEHIESSVGSENMPCWVNGYYVEESFNDIMFKLETT